MCNFGSCKTRFEFLSQFRKVRNAFQCFVAHRGGYRIWEGGVPRNFVNDNMWREAPLETPIFRRLRGKVRRGGTVAPSP